MRLYRAVAVRIRVKVGVSAPYTLTLTLILTLTLTQPNDSIWRGLRDDGDSDRRDWLTPDRTATRPEARPEGSPRRRAPGARAHAAEQRGAVPGARYAPRGHRAWDPWKDAHTRLPTTM